MKGMDIDITLQKKIELQCSSRWKYGVAYNMPGLRTQQIALKSITLDYQTQHIGPSASQI
jgi:hypothetical protein